MLRNLRLCILNQCRFFSNRNILSLREKGVIQDVFPESSDKQITNLLNSSPQCVYAGFDPTASSLHVGNLLVIINLLHWQRAGHQVITLVGGATGHIGDPSGRTKDRPQLEKIFVEKNLSGIKNNIQNIFENHNNFLWKTRKHELKPPIILNNEDWYKNMNAIDFVSKLGRYFRMGTMLLKQSVQSRISSEVGMSFTEFTYQIFQAYDWLHLYQNYDCRFQIGGNDQMGNIWAGHDLISRVEKNPVYGLTLPLITTEEGDKFGKSAGNAVWLDSNKTSPFSFYQYFLRTKDSEIEKLLNYFTFHSVPEIKNIMIRHNEKPENRIAQTTLAEFLTLLVHGKNGLYKAQQSSKLLYGNDIKVLTKMNAIDICQTFEGAPIVNLELIPGKNILDLALDAECFSNHDDAKRIIGAGGFYVNYQKTTNVNEILTESAHILHNKISLLRVGKKNYTIVKWI